MFGKLHNTAIRESLNIESHRIEKSQLRWFGEYLMNGLKTLYAKVSGKRPVGQPRKRWLDYVEGLCLSEMQSVLVDQEVWWLNLKLLLPQPSRKSR